MLFAPATKMYKSLQDAATLYQSIPRIQSDFNAISKTDSVQFSEKPSLTCGREIPELLKMFRIWLHTQTEK